MIEMTTNTASTLLRAAGDTAVIHGLGPFDGFPLVPAIVVVLAVSFFFPTIPRIFGGLMFLDALLTLWFNAWQLAEVAGFGFRFFGGLSLWLLGHLIFRLRFGGWRTRLGRAAWRRTPLRLISPGDAPA